MKLFAKVFYFIVFLNILFLIMDFKSSNIHKIYNTSEFEKEERKIMFKSNDTHEQNKDKTIH